jgi:hypothetical protein
MYADRWATRGVSLFMLCGMGSAIVTEAIQAAEDIHPPYVDGYRI